jgi:peptidoglycan hydrolase-like protein with peptidoglycan-binding domain
MTATKTLRPTLKIGAKGEHVRALQAGLIALGALGLVVDGDFGRMTDTALRIIQGRAGLVADGIAGPKVWALLGETWAASPTSSTQVDMRAPACVQALRDATAAWPKRSRASDGIMGDARHQAAGFSDHNVGNAVDITHDPKNGCDAGELATLALRDPRTSYVIWQGRIFNTSRASEGWRKRNKGPGDHELHVHVSVHAAKRNDASAWPWAPKVTS